MRWRDFLLAAALVAVPRAVRADDEASAVAPDPVAAPSGPLASFATAYETTGEHRARAFNVELAAQAIEGAVLAPGGTFSFNGRVGERTAAFGYEKSIVLRRRLLAEGTGGGTCQVASTLHAAALLAGLDVVDRTAHSRPSAYIRLGLDATVVYPLVDLKLRNPRADAVTLHARAAHGTLTVWLAAEGASRPVVSLTSEVVERLPYARLLERDARVPEGEVHVRAHGIPGYRVSCRREIVDAGRARRQQWTGTYPPTPEVLVVSPSFDPARLTLREAEDTPDGWVLPPVVTDEVGAASPAPSQLRPSTQVVLRNTPADAPMSAPDNAIENAPDKANARATTAAPR